MISHVANTSAPFGKCLYCKEMHNIYNCPNFLNLSIEQRINEIKKRKLCLNCLKGGHKLMSCNSSNCKKCNKRHNSLLHINERETSTSPEPSTSSLNSVSSHCAQILNKNITLSTAMINVCDEHGKLVQFRILLDNGSVSNFITERAVKQLGLKNVQTINLSLIGIGCSSSVINKTVSARISSIINNFNAKLEFLIVSEITGNIPSTSFSPINDIPINIKLADPLYNESKPVDILIGNEIFWDLMCVGQIRLSKQGPVLQKTQLGWIIGGVVGCFNNQKTSSCHVTNHSLEQEVKRFWEIEQYPEDQPPEINNICEKYFLEGSRRLENGRFSVKLPFVTNPPDIGESRNKALRLFYNLERRLHKDPHLFKQYSEFMATYLILGHMTEVANPNNSGYFLSHHPVINESSITTKLRVVFNASMQTTNNKSINDSLLVGPNLQQDLFGILIRFRFYKIVITGDIQKMYRQILLHEDHRKYQQIFWRDNINEPVKVFQLNTITYGFASSSYLATRCLLELARYAELEFPDAARTISTSFYVDDLICGGDTPEQAAQLLQEIKSILKGGGFELHKLNSNYPQVIYGNEQVGETYTVSLDKQGPTKTLGVLWDNNADAIRFSTWEKPASKVKVTKRIILSTVAKIFDPLGLVAPVTVTAKIILQKLWALKINWDESVPCDLYTIWKNFMKSLPELNSITIPRRVIHDSTQVQLHGFCDASQYAYGACIYLRTMYPSGTYRAKLLCAKSKVAPLKQLTIPRLELCAALLLARLTNKIIKIINIPISEKFNWSDSSIVLAWIRLNPSTLKTFVSHRINEIQSLTDISDWHYVPSSKNPADILSRGATPLQLKMSQMWWTGPNFLEGHHQNIQFVKDERTQLHIPEVKSVCCSSVTKPSVQFDLLTRFSTFSKLIRVTAFILRFINKALNKTPKFNGHLSCEELQRAHDCVIKLLQAEAFSEEIHNLKNHRQLLHNNKICNLNPFLDHKGILRVGGRLKNSNLDVEQKHQLLLPKSQHVTRLIIKKYHEDNLHSGCLATLSAIRQKYWPTAARSLIRRVIFSCFKCYRVKPVAFQQLMGDLPKERITQARPFLITGIDYGGPFVIKNGYGRTTKRIKIFIAIFVCFVTKAVHIEMVCDCTTFTFLNALKRFISRRGKPSHLYSDNGTTFVGANRQLQELKNLLECDEFKSNVLDNLANDNINWHFIPTRAPHMGGLWEAAIKSTKGHLKRVLGETLLNFEEMNTLLAMIEACLNSRPIIPISEDPNDLSSLTPGHFLIGTPLTAPAEPIVGELPTNRMNRYQLVESLRQHFWQRWSKEYLHNMQQRTKWSRTPTQRPALGDLVILKEDNTQPLQWPLGRICDIHPGQDGHCRVVTVKTVRGVYKRPLSKVCVVPRENEETRALNLSNKPPTVLI